MGQASSSADSARMSATVLIWPPDAILTCEGPEQDMIPVWCVVMTSFLVTVVTVCLYLSHYMLFVCECVSVDVIICLYISVHTVWHVLLRITYIVCTHVCYYMWYVHITIILYCHSKLRNCNLHFIIIYVHVCVSVLSVCCAMLPYVTI